jgi:hypothetical protein
VIYSEIIRQQNSRNPLQAVVKWLGGWVQFGLLIAIAGDLFALRGKQITCKKDKVPGCGSSRTVPLSGVEE